MEGAADRLGVGDAITSPSSFRLPFHANTIASGGNPVESVWLCRPLSADASVLRCRLARSWMQWVFFHTWGVKAFCDNIRTHFNLGNAYIYQAKLTIKLAQHVPTALLREPVE